MTKSKRVFIGIPISEKLKRFIKSWSKKNIKDNNFRIIPSQKLHITLIPPWNEKQIQIIADKLDNISNIIQPFKINFTKITPGPIKKLPRLIWLEGKKNNEAVLLKKELERILNKKGSSREFIPHITITRFNHRKSNIYNFNRMNKEINLKEEVNRICLYESTLSPKGSQYKILKMFEFS